MYGDLKILTGTANPQLALDICDHLGCCLTPSLCETFSDGEIRIEIGASVRGHDVFVIQPTCAPANYNFMQLCLMLDALKRASAGRITAVIPYYGYARQDRKVSPRAPISAKVTADFLSMAGAQRIVTMICTPGRFRASSTARWTTFTPARCCFSSSAICAATLSWFRPTPAAWSGPEPLPK